MYFIWSLLPLTLFLMAIWAFLKPILKVYGHEDGKRYLIMAACCTAVLYITIMIDKTDFIRSVVSKISMGMVDYSMIRLLLYPAMLYAGSLAWDFSDKKKK